MFAGLACSCGTAEDGDAFVRVENGRFVLDGKPCYFLGTNFWYGPILGSKGPGGDRERLARELDTLAACGVTNLRVLVGADGGGGVPSKIEPTLQYVPGKYNDELLDGLDYFLAELGRRGMKAVLYLTNSWEWSGGYSQYLAWTGAGKPAIPAVDGYEAYVEYVSHFIPSREARALLEEHVRFIVGRTNRYTGLRYADDPAIFSWQICNEPRPFGEQNKEAFAEWIARTARLIRSLDANHMISTGSEGFYGCEADMELVERIHAVPEISYVNLHIWPYNWNWTPRNDPASGLRNSMEETRATSTAIWRLPRGWANRPSSRSSATRATACATSGAAPPRCATPTTPASVTGCSPRSAKEGCSPGPTSGRGAARRIRPTRSGRRATSTAATRHRSPRGSTRSSTTTRPSTSSAARPKR